MFLDCTLLIFCLGINSASTQSGADSTSSSTPSATSSPPTDVTNIPIYNASVQGTPNGTSVQVYPDVGECDYSSGDSLYCFPYDMAFVSMTGWTRFFYNKYYGLLNNSGLVDITMYFAANDAPAASWIGVENTGNVPINVNISWFTSTLPATATYSAADPYYFYVRPNSAEYNSYPTGSSAGPTFYAVQTPVERLAVGVSMTASTGAVTSNTAAATSNSSAASATTAPDKSGGAGLSRGAIAGIVVGALALFFVLILIGLVLFLLLRRKRYAEEAAKVAAANQEKSRQANVVPGNLFTPSELFAAGLLPPHRDSLRTTVRPSIDQTDSSGSGPVVVNRTPLTWGQVSPSDPRIAGPMSAQIEQGSSAGSRDPFA